MADIDADDAPTKTMPVRGEASGALIGRQHELALVDEAADRAASGQRTGVFVTGPAGIGKSAFLAAATERICDASGWHLLRGQTLRPRGASSRTSRFSMRSRAPHDPATMQLPMFAIGSRPCGSHSCPR